MAKRYRPSRPIAIGNDYWTSDPVPADRGTDGHYAVSIKKEYSLPILSSQSDRNVPDVSGVAVIADDDETIRSLLEYKLSAAGFDLSVCANGGEAREVLNDPAIEPDVVVLDIMMPRLSGIQLLRTIRRGELAVDPDVPVILLTSRGREPDVLEGLKAGADEYLTKPFSPDELLVRIGKLLDE